MHGVHFYLAVFITTLFVAGLATRRIPYSRIPEIAVLTPIMWFVVLAKGWMCYFIIPLTFLFLLFLLYRLSKDPEVNDYLSKRRR